MPGNNLAYLCPEVLCMANFKSQKTASEKENPFRTLMIGNAGEKFLTKELFSETLMHLFSPFLLLLHIHKENSWSTGFKWWLGDTRWTDHSWTKDRIRIIWNSLQRKVAWYVAIMASSFSWGGHSACQGTPSWTAASQKHAWDSGGHQAEREPVVCPCHREGGWGPGLQ